MLSMGCQSLKHLFVSFDKVFLLGSSRKWKGFLFNMTSKTIWGRLARQTTQSSRKLHGIYNRKIFDFYQKSYPHLVESFPQMLSYMIYGWAEKMASFLGPHGELLKSLILFHISDVNLMMSILG